MQQATSPSAIEQRVSIRILETENNRRGDLFGRLMADLFIALGYEHPRLNIHKSGRELDISADHRLEPRCTIAECKATSAPIGGEELNKFIGVLDAETETGCPITGYFISLAGFKETALEQEKQRRHTKIILLSGSEIIDELIAGRIIIRKEQATELAGQYRAGLDLTLDPEPELLAHSRGWIWAIYYTQGKARTHLVLIHSDGTPLARPIADEVIKADPDGRLAALHCLNPALTPVIDSDSRVAEALLAYRQYLTNECGFIQLDGLPADTDVGSRRLRLENLFIPLHLDTKVGKKKKTRQPIDTLVSTYPRLAILAAPGGGKSTLLKHLAMTSAVLPQSDPSTDNSLDRKRLPLFFRCRELRNLARGSFANLLKALSEREPVRQHSAAFLAYIDSALLNGRILLLVDGLDEIADPGDRAAFVCTLRTALQAYQDIGIVVTSREAGFRHVAAHLAPICVESTLSPFDDKDINNLCIAWHCEVLGNTQKVRADAAELARTIIRSDRIKRVATNPLLLTTLLLVKRWVGSLPTRRAVLYGKAVEVLLMTWNTEGHDPIPEEEALPQLCYVASAMMLNGLQKISRPKLAGLLKDARSNLPTELGYVKETVDQFIHRIEDRSSLLTMTGHDVEDGKVTEFFEFRHLTFQEFLTARAMVEGWHPGRKDEDTLADVLEPYFDAEGWREVIPLAAALGGKATEILIQHLTQHIENSRFERSLSGSGSVSLVLLNCLVDEAAARPEIIRAALRPLIHSGAITPFSNGMALARGRYGSDLRDEAQKAFLAAPPRPYHATHVLSMAVWSQIFPRDGTDRVQQACARLRELLQDPAKIRQYEGALGFVSMCRLLSVRSYSGKTDALIQTMQPILLDMLFSENPPEQYAASWAAGFLGLRGLWTPPGQPDVLGRLFTLWHHSRPGQIRSRLSWSLITQPLAARDQGRFKSVEPTLIEKLLDPSVTRADGSRFIILVATWYKKILDDSEISRQVNEIAAKTNKSFVGIFPSRALPEFLKELNGGNA
jgi:NACHT domain-containing protein/restriction endonuclease